MKLKNSFFALCVSCLTFQLSIAKAQQQAPNYLSLSNGAYPVELSANAKDLKIDFAQAVQIIDGNHKPFLLNRRPGDAATTVDIVFRLPATTTFSSFKIPNVWGTPSPSQTFIQGIQIYGAMDYEPGDIDSTVFARLAEHSLVMHTGKNETTELEVQQTPPVRWIKVSLSGGINIKSSKMFFQFSELIGHGAQEVASMDERFNGAWKGRGVKLQLQQSGASVSGCYDRNSELEGTVSGNVLRATGRNVQTGVESLFILMVDDNGAIQGVRSSNGAPFSNYSADSGKVDPKQCKNWQQASLGCNSVIHGIQFEFNSAVITNQSATILKQLTAGLRASDSENILVEGHTSSEGSTEYNLNLSQRRAEAVRTYLSSNGIDEQRLSAKGFGETQPIATNADEIGRSLNRRVKIACSD